jgi:hypothetical protein
VALQIKLDEEKKNILVWLDKMVFAQHFCPTPRLLHNTFAQFAKAGKNLNSTLS